MDILLKKKIGKQLIWSNVIVNFVWRVSLAFNISIDFNYIFLNCIFSNFEDLKVAQVLYSQKWKS